MLITVSVDRSIEIERERDGERIERNGDIGKIFFFSRSKVPRRNILGTKLERSFQSIKFFEDRATSNTPWLVYCLMKLGEDFKTDVIKESICDGSKEN